MDFRLSNYSVLILILFIGINCGKLKPVKEITFIYSSDNNKIAIKDKGQGDTTLFFIHGWCINKEYWINQLNFFSDRYRCVAIDLPGFGASDKNRIDWDFEQYSQDVLQCIDSLKLKNIILIGHSMSGDIVLNVAARHHPEVIGIIGIDNLHAPASVPDSIQAKNTEDFFKSFEVSYDSIASYGMGPYLFQASTADSIKKRVMNDVSNTNASLSVNVLRALDKIAQNEKNMMNKLKIPLKLVNSDVQPVQLDSLNKYCAKGAKVFYVHGTGHYPMIENPYEFNLALQTAIQSN